MTVDEEALVQQMMDEAPFRSRAEARSALRATLAALRSALTDDEAAALAEELNGPSAEALRRGSYQGELTPEELYGLVACHEGRRASIAVEHAQIVCATLAKAFSASTLQRLSRQLPQLATLFGGLQLPRPPPGPHSVRATPAPERTLAGGRPGASRPLSDARPSQRALSDAVPELAHAHSVARSDDPHADTKLSSASGMTQERESESLARSRKYVP